MSKLQKNKISELIRQFIEDFQHYPVIITFDLTDIKANMLKQLRKKLALNSKISCMSNKFILVALNQIKSQIQNIDQVKQMFKKQIGVIFTWNIQQTIRLVDDIYAITYYKLNDYAQTNIYLEENQTSKSLCWQYSIPYFQALNIPWMVKRAQLTVKSDVCLIKANKKITIPHLKILNDMDMKIKKIKINCLQVYTNGSVMDANSIRFTDQEIVQKFHSWALTFYCLNLGVPSDSFLNVYCSMGVGFRYLLAMQAIYNELNNPQN